MPKLSQRILANDREVSATKDQGEFRIKGVRNLVLRVTAAGTKSWSFAYPSPVTLKWRKLSLGSYPTVSLAEAKDRALKLGVEIRQGNDLL